MELNLNGIPEELKKLPNWVNWTVEERNGKPTKVPINPKTGGQAQSNNPSTWGTYDQAVHRWKESENGGIEGIGFMFSDGYSGVDFDKCRNPQTGHIESWAKEIVDWLNSYTEISVSGTGLHTLTKGALPQGGRRKGNLEMYNKGRFFTVTGYHLDGTPETIELREAELKDVHNCYINHQERPSKVLPKNHSNHLITDFELVENAKQAANGEKFTKLWSRDWSDYPSQSEADLALCLMLSFWTGRDAARIDALFRRSGLMREKWDEKHYGDGTTYGQKTIQTAIERTSDANNPTPKIESINDDEETQFSYLTLNLPSSLEISRLDVKVDWVVKNLIPKESIALLHSIGGVGKSYLMYGIAKAVADGESFYGLDVTKMNVYYIDFENPLPEIVDRMKKIGGSENLKIWHLGHDPMPIRFDADEWEIYKTFPPGLFIIDSLRSSHLLEENSSKDASFIMARHKEIRASGSTIILIHHENKLGGYRGSTAWFDLSDHILKFSRVKKIGSDEDVEEDNFDLPIRLGLGGKSRFSSALELKPIYFKFKDHLLCLADNPDDEILGKMTQLLDSENPPCRAEFEKLVKDNLGYKRKVFDRLVKAGEKRNLWVSRKTGDKNKLGFFRT